MRFRELAERHRNMKFYIEIYGAAPRITEELKRFYNILHKHYPVIEADNHSFLEREVLKEVEDAFNAPFEEFRKTYRNIIGRSRD